MKRKINAFKLFGAIVLVLMTTLAARPQQTDDAAVETAVPVKADDAATTKIKADKYLEQREADLKRISEPRRQLYILIYLAPAAFDAGELGKAGDYARQLLEVGQKLQNPPGFGLNPNGLAVHIGNTVLGRIALREGKTEEAKQHLLAAGEVTGRPPTLVSFGPNMQLAKELFEKGEKETVSKYLELCGIFWTRDNGRTAGWKKSIENGENPNFGSQVTTSWSSWKFDKRKPDEL